MEEKNGNNQEKRQLNSNNSNSPKNNSNGNAQKKAEAIGATFKNANPNKKITTKVKSQKNNPVKAKNGKQPNVNNKKKKAIKGKRGNQKNRKNQNTGSREANGAQQRKNGEIETTKRRVSGARGFAKKSGEKLKRGISKAAGAPARLAGKATKKVGKGIQKVGQDVKKVGKSIEKTGKSVEKAGKTIKGVAKGVQYTGKAIKGTGKAMQAASQGVKLAGNATDAVGNVTQGIGQAVAAIPYVGTVVGGIIGGVGVAESGVGKAINKMGELGDKTGQGVEKAGEKVDEHGKKVEAKGQKVVDKGKNIQDKGKNIQDKGQNIENKGQDIEDAGQKLDNFGLDIENKIYGKTRSLRQKLKKKIKSRIKRLMGDPIENAKAGIKRVLMIIIIVVLFLIIFIIVICGVIFSFIDGFSNLADGAGDIIFDATTRNISVSNNAGVPYTTINEDKAWETLQGKLKELGLDVQSLGFGSEEKAKKVLMKFYKASLVTSSLALTDDQVSKIEADLPEGETLIRGVINIQRTDPDGNAITLTYIDKTSQEYIDLDTILNTNGGAIESPTDDQKNKITDSINYYSVDENGNLIVYYYKINKVTTDLYGIGDDESKTSLTDTKSFRDDFYSSDNTYVVDDKYKQSTESTEVYTLYKESVNYEVLCQRYGVSFDFLIAISVGMQDTNIAEAIADYALENTSINVEIRDSYDYLNEKSKYMYEGEFIRTDHGGVETIVKRANATSSSGTFNLRYDSENKNVSNDGDVGGPFSYVYNELLNNLANEKIINDDGYYYDIIDTACNEAKNQTRAIHLIYFLRKTHEIAQNNGDMLAVWDEACNCLNDYSNQIENARTSAKNVTGEARLGQLDTLKNSLQNIQNSLRNNGNINQCYDFFGTNNASSAMYWHEVVYNEANHSDGFDLEYYETKAGNTISIDYNFAGKVDERRNEKRNAIVPTATDIMTANWSYYSWRADIHDPAKQYNIDALKVVTTEKTDYTPYIYVKDAESWFLNEEFILNDITVNEPETSTLSGQEAFEQDNYTIPNDFKYTYVMGNSEYEEQSAVEIINKITDNNNSKTLEKATVKYEKVNARQVDRKIHSTIESSNSTDNKDIILGFIINSSGETPYGSDDKILDKATLEGAEHAYVGKKDGGKSVQYKNLLVPLRDIYKMFTNTDSIAYTRIFLSRSTKAQADEQVYRYLIYELTEGRNSYGIENISYSVFDTKTFYKEDMYGYLDYIFPISRENIPDKFFYDEAHRYLNSEKDGDSVVHSRDEDSIGKYADIYWDSSEGTMSGVQVLADRDGEAHFYANDDNYGNYIEIYHDDGGISYYYNLENFAEIYTQNILEAVQGKEKIVDVEQGQVLGVVGHAIKNDKRRALSYQVKDASGNAIDLADSIDYMDPWGENLAEFISFTMKYEGTDLWNKADENNPNAGLQMYVSGNTPDKTENGMPINGEHYAIYGGPKTPGAKVNSYGYDVTLGYGISAYYNLGYFQDAGLFTVFSSASEFNNYLSQYDTYRIYDAVLENGKFVQDKTKIIEDEEIYSVNVKIMYDHYKEAIEGLDDYLSTKYGDIQKELEAVKDDPDKLKELKEKYKDIKPTAKDYTVAQLVALGQLHWGSPAHYSGWISSYLVDNPVKMFQGYSADYGSPGVEKRAKAAWVLFCTGNYDYEAKVGEPWYDPKKTAEEIDKEKEEWGKALKEAIGDDKFANLSDTKKGALNEAYEALGKDKFKEVYKEGNEVEVFKAWADKVGTDEALGKARSAYGAFVTDDDNYSDISPLQQEQANSGTVNANSDEMRGAMEEWRNKGWDIEQNN